MKTPINQPMTDCHNFDSDDERKPAAREKPEAACLTRPSLLQVTGKPWIDNCLTEDMLKELTKNPHRDFKELIEEILSKAKNKKTTGHIWLTLQYLLDDVLTLTREDENKQNKSGGVIGLPTNAAGNRKTNKRTKRNTER